MAIDGALRDLHGVPYDVTFAFMLDEIAERLFHEGEKRRREVDPPQPAGAEAGWSTGGDASDSHLRIESVDRETPRRDWPAGVDTAAYALRVGRRSEVKATREIVILRDWNGLIRCPWQHFDVEESCALDQVKPLLQDNEAEARAHALEILATVFPYVDVKPYPYPFRESVLPADIAALHIACLGPATPQMVRVRFQLLRAGLTTVGQVAAHSDEELLMMRNVGVGTVTLLRDLIARLALEANDSPVPHE